MRAAVAIAQCDPRAADQRQRRDQHERRSIAEQRRQRTVRRHAAQYRPDNHARAERHRHDAHVAGLVRARAHVGNGRLSNTLAARHQPAQAAARQQQRETRQPRAERHEQIAQCKAEHAHHQHLAAAEGIGQFAHQRGAKEHTEGVYAVAQPQKEVAPCRAKVRIDHTRMRIGEDCRHDRIDETEAHRVDGNGKQAGAKLFQFEFRHDRPGDFDMPDRLVEAHWDE